MCDCLLEVFMMHSLLNLCPILVYLSITLVQAAVTENHRLGVCLLLSCV